MAAKALNVPLLGGDTVAMPAGAPRTLGLTAIGRATGPVPARSGGAVGDALYIAGTIGDAGLGLAIAMGRMAGPEALVMAYRRPQPLLEMGQALAGQVTAMMDVSDGVLIDALRLAEASGVGVAIDLDAIPMSEAALSLGQDRAARLRAATAGDDYALLFTSALPLRDLPGRPHRIGQLVRAPGLQLSDGDGPVPLPDRLGWLHQG
jgi:thiamine-monophosphate kinase